MPIEKLKTSKAKQVEMDLFNYDSVPLSGTYKNKSDGTPLDLTNYKFEFFLYLQNNVERSYTINAGILSTAHLSKTGDDLNILNMQAMLQDIRDKTVSKAKYRLVQVVTQPDVDPFVYIVYYINAERY